MSRAEERIRVVYMHSPSRKSAKILPLLDGLPTISIKGWRDLKGLRRAFGGDVVIIDQFGRWALYGLLASLFLRAPLVVRLRGEFFREEMERARNRTGPLRSWPRYLLNVLLARLCLRRARLVLPNSRYLAQATAIHYARPEKVRVIPSPNTPLGGGDVPVPKLPEGGLKLATVSDMVLWPKVRPLFEAIEGLPEGLWEDLDVRWVVCGSGPHEARLRGLVRERGLSSRVLVLGRVEPVAAVYGWCDVLVHLSGMDAFPSVPMEAMSYEKPVVTNADSCGTREMVFDGFNGRVVGDGAGLAAALRRYAADPGSRARHGRAGRSFVEENLSVPVLREEMRRVLLGLVR